MSEQLTITITARDGASQVFRTVGTSAQGMGRSVEQASQAGARGFASFGAAVKTFESEITTVGVALTAFGAATTAAFGLAARGSIQLEQAMANIRSIAEAGTDIEGLTEEIRELSVEMARSPTELAEGLYEITSSGFAATEAMEILDDTTRAAVAGMTDSETATRAVVGVLNAYKLEAESAGDVSDIFFKTVETGTASFEALANNLSQVLPLASSLNVSFEELATGFAQLSLDTFSAAAAETGLAAIMRSALRPTEELTAAVQDLGHESVEALLQAEGLAGLLDVLADASGGTAEGMGLLLSDIQGINAALSLTSGGTGTYTAALREMEAAARDGATTQEAFAIQTDTAAFAIQQAQTAISVAAGDYADALAPAIRAAAEAATAGASAFRQLPEGLQTVVAVSGTATGAIALFTGGLVLAIPKVVEFTTAIRTLQAAGGLAAVGTAAATVSGPLAVFGAVLAGLSGPIIGLAATTGQFVGEMRRGASPTEAFADAATRLGAAMDELQSGDPVGFFRTLIFGIEEASVSMEQFNTTVTTLLDEAARQQVLGNTEVAASIEDLVGTTVSATFVAEEYLNSAQFLADANIIAANTTGDLEVAQQGLREEWSLNEAEMRVYNEAINVLAAAMLNPANNASEIQAKIGELDQQLRDHEITLDQYREGLVELAREYGDLPNDIGDVSDAIATLNDGAMALASVFPQVTDETKSAKEQLEELFEVVEEGATLLEGADLLSSIFGEPVTAKQQVQETIAEVERANEALHELFVTAASGAGGTLLGLSEDMEAVTEEAHALAEALYVDLGASMVRVVEDAEAARAALVSLLDTSWDAGVAGVTAYGDALRELQGRMMAFGGFDTPVAMVDLLGLGETTEQMAELETHAERTMASIVHGAIDARASITDIAEQTLIVQSALDNTFRIMISNVEAMGQSAQGTFDFLDELFTLNDEGFSQADVLLNQGRLSWNQYTAAADAYNNVANDNYAIQQDLLAIQAQQAPVLATLVAQQQDYIERLREMPADQQALALGWMDATTAAQAYEAVALAASVANGELGSSGEQMFQQMVTGAVAANPVLGEMLEQMGLISIGADGTITLHLDGFEDADSAIIDLTNSIDALTLALGGIPPVRIDAETEGAAEAIAAVEEQLGGLDGQSAGVTINGDSTPAEAAMQRAFGALQAIDGQTGTVHAEGDNAGALSAVRGASTALAALDGNTATVHINAINNAGAAIGAVASSLASLDGRTATTYVRTVNLGTVGGGVGSLFQHGGIAGYAEGGLVTARMGEAGAEMLHFANGGTAWAMQDALYTVPMGTLVSPANANPGGGATYEFFRGATFIGTNRAEMQRWAEEDLAPSLMKALDDRDHAYGGWR